MGDQSGSTLTGWKGAGMSFFDKAKQAATEMAAKADQAMANAGISGPPGGITGSLG